MAGNVSNPSETGGIGVSRREHSGVAGANLVGKQFYFVKETSAGVVACSAAGEMANGILTADGTPYAGATDSTGYTVKYASDGFCALKMSTTCSIGDLITTDANGLGKAVITAGVPLLAGSPPYPIAGSNVLARALQAAGAANDVIMVEILHAGLVPTTAD